MLLYHYAKFSSNELHYQFDIHLVQITDFYNNLWSSHQLQRDQPLHCAGSIKIESQGLLLIDHIYSNDPFAILGLPLTALNEMFQAEEINLLTDFT